MLRYRKRPLLVEAEQFLPNMQDRAWPAGVEHEELHTMTRLGEMSEAPISNWFVFTTNNGKVNILDGDYVLTDADGVRSVCARKRFEDEYEPWLPAQEALAGPEEER